MPLTTAGSSFFAISLADRLSATMRNIARWRVVSFAMRWPASCDSLSVDSNTARASKRRAHERAAVKRHADRPHQLVGRGELEDVAGGADPERASTIARPSVTMPTSSNSAESMLFNPCATTR